MKIAIVGSRKRNTPWDNKAVNDLVDSFDSGTLVVSGGCRGVDTWAVNRALDRGLHTRVFYPNIRKDMQYHHMVEEYYRRNREIVDNSDMVYAFIAPDGIDRGGTWYTINYAKLKGKEVILR